MEDIVVASAKNPGDLKESLEEYINQDHIKNVIVDAKFENIRKDLHGRLLHAALSNNPHNFVRGPEPKDRAFDPRDGIDQEILNQQTDGYKRAAEPFVKNDPARPPTIDDYGNLPRPQPVPVTRRSENGKSVVNEV